MSTDEVKQQLDKIMKKDKESIDAGEYTYQFPYNIADAAVKMCFESVFISRFIKAEAQKRIEEIQQYVLKKESERKIRNAKMQDNC